MYDTQKNIDGKFHAGIYDERKGQETKDLVFGKRKVAKKHAYHWFCQREALLKKREATPRKQRLKPQLSETEKKIKQLRTKIANATKRQQELEKIIKQSQTRIKRAQTKKTKWEFRQRRYEKQIANIRPQNGRIKGFIESLK
jgi:septal ring factor EnvC (AmiA/AmiB activator)